MMTSLPQAAARFPVRIPTTWMLCAVLAAVLLTVPTATPASAQAAGWDVERFEAPTGTGISTVVTRRAWPDASTVVLARGDQFADALAAAPVAALVEGPLLLTDRAALPRHVWEQIEHFSPERAILMGGDAAIGNGVVDELSGLGVENVVRIAGANRFETAVAAMDFVHSNGGDADPFVVRGEGAGHIGGWEDAVAVSQHAAMLGAPILLTRQGDLPSTTAAALARIDADTVTIVGGEAAVSGSVSDALWAHADVRRLEGPSRYQTSLAVADASMSAGADARTLWLVSGTSWQDALVAGATAGTSGGVLVYVNPHAWRNSPGRGWVMERSGTAEQINIVGSRDRLPTEVDFDLVDQGTPHPSWSPPSGVAITPADDPQAVVDAHPPGTTFVFTSGTHHLVQVEPRTGDRFTGQPGAVLTGAVTLDTSQAHQAADGLWVVPGVTHDPPPPPVNARTEEGRQGEALQSDLFVGDTRLTHTGQRSTLTRPGQWHLDTANDQILLFDDPAALGQLQLSVTPWAFASPGAEVADVEIDHLRVERYASMAKGGAIDAHNGWNWDIHHVTVSRAQGGGVRTGAGARVADSRLVHNGQIGITGGDHAPSGRRAPVVIERNEIAFNGEVGYKWDWEAGGAKMTNTTDGVFSQNWSHHNRGPGLWCDLDCLNPQWLDNLVEHNAYAGILIEETVQALAQGNTARANGAFAWGDLGGGIWVSNSPGVELSHNVLESNRLPIIANHNGIPAGSHGPLEIADLYVHHNDIRVDAYLPGLRVRTNEPSRYTRDDIVWEDNTYRLRSDRAAHFWWDGRAVTVQEWQDQYGHDLQGRFLDADAPASPTAAFDRVPYGAG